VPFGFTKLVWILLTPSNVLILLATLGVLLAAAGRAAGIALALASLGIVLLATVLPLGLWLMAPLEDRFPPPEPAPERVDGIVALGGGIDTTVSAARNQPAIGGTGERYAALIELHHRYPAARLAFTGGIGRLGGAATTEAAVMQEFYRAQGLPPERVLFEDQARTTRENALFLKTLAKPQPGERWLLVTSARHMPRSIGVFRAVGWPVEPWPVDYRTAGAFAWQLDLRVGKRLAELDGAVYEWLALLYYRLAGWTPTLLPSAET
jgi:uncharacterized SAM-binding protein YcdF (DUF218 family)